MRRKHSQLSKSGPAMKPGPSRGSALEQARWNKGGFSMGHPAMKKRGTNFVPGTNSVPEIDEDDDFSAKFKAVIMPFPRKHVAKIAKCSTETVKAWCKDPPRQKPQWEHMYRLALGLKGVRNLIRREIDPTFASPRAMHEVINSLQDLADQPGPEGDTARAILRNAMGAMS